MFFKNKKAIINLSMFDFFTPKTKVRYFALREVPIEDFEVIGISQINPYYNKTYDNEIFLTVVNFANTSRRFDEKEGLILSEYFTLRRCFVCKKLELLPVKIKINMSKSYLENDEIPLYDTNYDLKHNFPSIVNAYCNNCNSCFEIHIKHKDLWVKEAKKIKETDLITSSWEEYRL